MNKSKLPRANKSKLPRLEKAEKKGSSTRLLKGKLSQPRSLRNWLANMMMTASMCLRMEASMITMATSLMKKAMINLEDTMRTESMCPVLSMNRSTTGSSKSNMGKNSCLKKKRRMNSSTILRIISLSKMMMSTETMRASRRKRQILLCRSPSSPSMRGTSRNWRSASFRKTLTGSFLSRSTSTQLLNGLRSNPRAKDLC